MRNLALTIAINLVYSPSLYKLQADTVMHKKRLNWICINWNEVYEYEIGFNEIEISHEFLMVEKCTMCHLALACLSMMK